MLIGFAPVIFWTSSPLILFCFVITCLFVCRNGCSFLWIPLSTRFDRQLAMMNPGWQLYNMCYPNPFSDILHDFLAHPTRSLPRSMFAKEPLPTAQPSESRRNWHHTVTWMGPFMERDEAIPTGWFGALQWHVCWFLNTIHTNTLPELLIYHAKDIHTLNRGVMFARVTRCST